MKTEDIEQLLRMPSQDEGAYKSVLPDLSETPAHAHIRWRTSLGSDATRRLSGVIATVLVVVVAAAGFVALRGPLASPTSPLPGTTPAVYACGGASFTPAGARGIDAATPTDPLTVLHGLISRHGSALPADGWQVAESSPTTTLFVAQTDDFFGWKFVLAAAVAGRWSANAYGDCEPAVPPAIETAQFGFAQWVVVNAQPDRSSVDVQVQSSFCWQTFLGPTVWYTQSTVVVTYWTRLLPEPSGQVCPLDLQFQPSTLTLIEPLGNRAILAGPASAQHPADVAPTNGS